MRLPNWVKILWWIFLIFLVGIILFQRKEALLSGLATPFDILAFLIFIALLLVPIFTEIELFGIKLKQQIESLKREVKTELGEIKTELRLSQVQTVNNHIQGFGPPPPDSKLPELNIEIEKIVNAKLKDHKITVDKVNHIDVPDDSLNMFRARYNIEKELRRIWENKYIPENYTPHRRNISITQIITDLTRTELLKAEFDSILREMLSICNYAIHGKDLSRNQIFFVESNAKNVIDYLKQIE